MNCPNCATNLVRSLVMAKTVLQYWSQAASDLNPMDFIEHDPTTHPMMPPFDLDPFDMLGEFSELDQYGGKIQCDQIVRFIALWQLFKACGNNYLVQIANIFRQFL